MFAQCRLERSFDEVRAVFLETDITRLGGRGRRFTAVVGAVFSATYFTDIGRWVVHDDHTDEFGVVVVVVGFVLAVEGVAYLAPCPLTVLTILSSTDRTHG